MRILGVNDSLDGVVHNQEESCRMLYAWDIRRHGIEWYRRGCSVWRYSRR